MKRRGSNLVVGLVIIAALLMVALVPIPTYAAEVWSDNFDDGDHDNWTVRAGTFNCANYTLAGIADSTPEGPTHDGMDNEIWINSTVTHGSWSFDLYFGGQSFYGPAIWFVADVVLHGDWVEAGWPGGHSLCLQREREYWYLHQVNGEEGQNLASWSATDEGFDLETGYHVDITFNDDGYFRLWVNETYIGQERYSTPIESQNVLIVMNNGSWFDNFVVSDTIDFLAPWEITTTSTDTTTTTTNTTTESPTGGEPAPIPMELVAVGIAVPAVIIIAVVVMKMKRP